MQRERERERERYKHGKQDEKGWSVRVAAYRVASHRRTGAPLLGSSLPLSLHPGLTTLSTKHSVIHPIQTHPLPLPLLLAATTLTSILLPRHIFHLSTVSLSLLLRSLLARTLTPVSHPLLLTPPLPLINNGRFGSSSPRPRCPSRSRQTLQTTTQATAPPCSNQLEVSP